MTAPTISPLIRITEGAAGADPSAPRPRTAEITVDIASGDTRVHHRLVAECDNAATAQAILAAHLTGLAVAFAEMAAAPEAILATELEGGLDGWTGTVAFPFEDRVAGRTLPFQVTVPGASSIDDAKAKAGDLLTAFADELRKGQDTLVIRAAGRPNQMRILAGLAPDHAYVRAGLEGCDVL